MSERVAVLVVDDEPGIRDMLSFELEQEGFDVETAENGLAAVVAMRRRKFDLALTDLRMPGMDGVETVEALRALDPDIEVIVATGYASVDTAVACMKRGAFDYIQKPYDLNELKLLLDRAMQKSHLQGVVALYEASRALLAALRQPDLVRIVVAMAHRVLVADDVGLVLWQDNPKGFEVHRIERSKDPSDALLHDLAERVRTMVLPLRVPSPAVAMPAMKESNAYASVLVYPLTGHDRSLGALVVLRRLGSPHFLLSELQKGAVFANQLALTLDNAHLANEVTHKVTELLATRELPGQDETVTLAGYLAGAVAHDVDHPLAFVQANLGALRDYSSSVGSLWLAAKAAALYLREQSQPAAQAHAQRLCESPIAEQHTDQLVQDIAEIVDETLDGVRRIADLVAGFPRVAATDAAAPAETVDIDQVIKKCIAVLPRTNVSYDGASDKPTLAAVARDDLHTALVNLMSFASAPGRRRSSENPVVTIQITEEAGRPCVVISDDTLILSSEQRRQILDPRVDVDATGGSAMRLHIALALAYELLRRNNAELAATFGEGSGLSFRVHLRAPST